MGTRRGTYEEQRLTFVAAERLPLAKVGELPTGAANVLVGVAFDDRLVVTSDPSNGDAAATDAEIFQVVGIGAPELPQRHAVHVHLMRAEGGVETTTIRNIAGSYPWVLPTPDGGVVEGSLGRSVRLVWCAGPCPASCCMNTNRPMRRNGSIVATP